MATIISGAIAVLKFIGAGSAVQGAIGLASAAFSIASGVNQYNKAKQQQRKAESLREAQRDSVNNYRNPVEPLRIIYGETRLGGPIIFAEEAGGGPTLHLVIAMAGHEVEQIGDVYVNDELITFDGSGVAAGKYAHIVYAKKYLGGTSQGLRAALETDGPILTTGCDNLIATDEWDGIACLYIRLWRWAKKFQDSPNFSAVVKGKKVYDPRTDTTAWSANPALCAADYLVNFAGFAYEQIDEATLIAAANVCDEDVALKVGGTEKRYTCNGVIVSSQAHEEVLGMFQDAMAGRIVYTSGSWRIYAGAPSASSAGASVPWEIDGDAVQFGGDPAHFSAGTRVAYTENDLDGPYSYSFDTTDRDLPNIVRGSFIDPSQEWQPVSYPARKDASHTLGKEIALDLDLPLTNSYTMAQRIAEIALRRSRATKSISMPGRPRTLLSQPGDVVTFQSEILGTGAEEFEVLDQETIVAVENGERQFRSNLFLREYSDAFFDWDEATDEADMEIGTTNLGGVAANFPTDTDAVETINSTGPTLDVEYAITWTDPDTQATKDLDRIEARVTVTVNTDMGSEEFVISGNAAPGAETIDLMEDYAYSNTYVDHEWEAELRACYDDGTCSEWIPAPQ